MINTILTDILRTFSAEELNKFGDMIRSPYFNKQSTAVKLFDQIKNYYPDFKNEALRKENVYLKMFPDKKYNYGSMKNIIHDLQKLAELFIADQVMKKNKFEIKRSLIYSLLGRNLRSFAEKNITELEKETLEKELMDEGYYLKLFKIDKLKQLHISGESKGNLNRTEKSSRQYFENLFNSTKNLKKYFQLVTLRSYNSIFTNELIINTDEAIRDYNTFIQAYTDEEFEDASLNLENNFLKMNLRSISENEFMKLKKLVLTDLYEMKADKKTIYEYSIFLHNFCSLKNQEDKQYRYYAFEIMKSLADHNNLESESGYIDIVLARNLIFIAAGYKENEWCGKFLKTYSDKIHPDYRDNLVMYYNMYKYFYEGRFDKSLEYSSKIKFDDIFDKTTIKDLMIVNYYELKYFDLLNEQLDAYKKFLSGNERLPDSFKLPRIKFAEYMYKLFKAASGKKTDLSLLKRNALDEKEFQNKIWFIKKIEELEIGSKKT